MAKMNFGGVIENVITREEFPLSKALETLKDETIAVIGYGVQGPGPVSYTHLALTTTGWNRPIIKNVQTPINKPSRRYSIRNSIIFQSF